MPLFLHLFFFYTLYAFIHHSFVHKHSLSPISISSQLQAHWAEPPWGAEPRFELGPAFEQASALPTKPRCTLTKPRCTLLRHAAPWLSYAAPWRSHAAPYWATLHPWEVHAAYMSSICICPPPGEEILSKQKTCKTIIYLNNTSLKKNTEIFIH